MCVCVCVRARVGVRMWVCVSHCSFLLLQAMANGKVRVICVCVCTWGCVYHIVPFCCCKRWQMGRLDTCVCAQMGVCVPHCSLLLLQTLANGKVRAVCVCVCVCARAWVCACGYVYHIVPFCCCKRWQMGRLGLYVCVCAHGGVCTILFPFAAVNDGKWEG